MQQRESLERLIQQISDAVTQIECLVKEGRIDEAEQTLDATWSSAMNLQRYDIQRLNDAAVILLLGAKATCASPLFQAQAAIEDARGAAQTATELRRRAVDLVPAGRLPR